MASVKQIQVTFDCAEPERVARFWCEVLGYVVPPPPQGFATWAEFDRALPPERQGSAFACVDPSGAGPRLFFQRVPEGKVVKNRLHLDVRVGTGLVGEERLAALEAECARLVALGAVRVRLLPADDHNESCLLMQDIEGNEFDRLKCLVAGLLRVEPPIGIEPMTYALRGGLRSSTAVHHWHPGLVALLFPAGDSTRVQARPGSLLALALASSPPLTFRYCPRSHSRSTVGGLARSSCATAYGQRL